MTDIQRILIERDPFGCDVPHMEDMFDFYQWPARWIAPEGAHADEPCVFAARLEVELEQPATVRLHVSADQLYELYLDGSPVGRGPERSDPEHWAYATYRVNLDAGEHVLAARIVYAADRAGTAQMTFSPGFLCAAEGRWGDTFSTGRGGWRVRRLAGYEFRRVPRLFLAMPRVRIDTARYEDQWMDPETGGWAEPETGRRAAVRGHTDTPPGHVMYPSMLPAMRMDRVDGAVVRHAVEDPTDLFVRPEENSREVAAAAQALMDGTHALEMPPQSTWRIVLDFESYLCAYERLHVSGGAGGRVEVAWAEGAYVVSEDEEPHNRHPKGNRDKIEGKAFWGAGDRWLLDGREHRLDSPYWNAGRYAVLTLTTADEPLAVHSYELIDTGYPLELEAEFESSDQGLADLPPLLWAGLRACSHETYMDCPYYERLMYVGDTRLEALTTFAGTRDERLPRKAVKAFDWSREPEGLTASRYPSRARQTIPTFSLWWVCLVYDYAMWRDDAETVRGCMKGVRSVLDAFLEHRREDGLLASPLGWNFVDWVGSWTHGMPPTAPEGPSGPLNWQAVLALGYAGELEAAFGEPELAARWERHRAELLQAMDALWDEGRGLFADDLEHTLFSEHSQALSLISGGLHEARRDLVLDGLLGREDLAEATIYFSHYVLDALTREGRVDAVIERLAHWKGLRARGFVTTPEKPEPTRSDCHAWGAHPLHHMFAGILGIRPAAPGFSRVTVRPQLGGLEWARGRLPHPAGWVEAEVRQEDGVLHGRVTLPAGVAGTLLLPDGERQIASGERVF
jgi:hypothetical protein